MSRTLAQFSKIFDAVDFTQWAVVLGLLIAAFWLQLLVKYFFNRLINKKMQDDATSVPVLAFIAFAIRILIWSGVTLLVLDNLGLNISALLAGLGIGGIALALASQKVLEDVFSYLSIVFDKPFGHGDSIVVGDFTGDVEHIGLKTTRLRSLSGEQLVFSNSDLLGSRIRNFKHLRERRIAFITKVAFDTPRAKLEQLPTLIRLIIAGHRQVRFDRCHFVKIADLSLDFETVYFMSVPDFNVFMEVQQSINLELLERLSEEGIQLAHPLPIPK